MRASCFPNAKYLSSFNYCLRASAMVVVNERKSQFNVDLSWIWKLDIISYCEESFVIECSLIPLDKNEWNWMEEFRWQYRSGRSPNNNIFAINLKFEHQTNNVIYYRQEWTVYSLKNNGIVSSSRRIGWKTYEWNCLCVQTLKSLAKWQPKKSIEFQVPVPEMCCALCKIFCMFGTTKQRAERIENVVIEASNKIKKCIFMTLLMMSQ